MTLENVEKMKIRAKDLIEIVCNIDNVLHDHGFIVDHDVLGQHLLKIIKESYPNHNVELEITIAENLDN